MDRPVSQIGMEARKHAILHPTRCSKRSRTRLRSLARALASSPALRLLTYWIGVGMVRERLEQHVV